MSDNDSSGSSGRTDETNTDPSQTTVPRHGGSMSILGEDVPILGAITFGNAPMLIPTIIFGVGMLGFALARVWLVALFFGALAILSGIAAAVVISTVAWHSTPLQRSRDWIAYLALKRSMPWSYHDALAREIHGVEEVYRHGQGGSSTIETSDGRFVRLIRVEGVNTNGLSDSDADQMVGGISSGLDERAGSIPVHFYSTTSDFDPEEVAGHYLDAADETRLNVPGMAYVREMYHRAYEWFVDENEPTWQGKDWRHYVVTEVAADDVSTYSDDTETSAVREILWPPSVRDISISDRRAMLNDLDRNEQTIRTDVIGAVQGCESHSVGASESIALLRSYWGDDGQRADPRAGSDLDRAGEEPADPDAADVMVPTPTRSGDEIAEPSHVTELVSATKPSEDADTDDAESRYSGGLTGWATAVRPTRVLLERLPYVGPDPDPTPEEIAAYGSASRDAITPEGFNATRHHASVGGTLTKTLWVAKWPQNVESLFLRKLVTMRGADFSLKVFNQPLDKQEIVDALKYDVRDLIIEESEEGDQLSSMELGDDKETYARLYQLLRKTSAQPWQINGYITVRVTEQLALEHAAESGSVIGEDVDLSTYQHRLLRDITDDVRKVAEGHPANLELVEHRERRRECFIAGSPAGRDEFSLASATESVGKRVAGSLVSEGVHGALESNKVTLGAGGAVGAMMPWCSARVIDKDAPLWGRNEHNGSPLAIDPFDRGSSGHMLTVGKTRGGKTYSVTNVVQRWYNARDDRTLIVCDTQGGFTGLTEYCGGKHVVVDGSQEINPLHVEPVPEEKRSTLEGDAAVLQQKIEEVAEFFRSALVAQGAENASDYTSDLEEMATEAFNHAGIYIDDPDSLANESPGISDFLEAGSRLLHEAEERSISGHDAEVSRRESRLGELLNYLSGFRTGGKYHDLLGGGDSTGMGIGLDDPDVDMVYLDLRRFRRHDDVDKSVMLQLLLGQVTQSIRTSEGESIFVCDEAHVMYHSQETVRWMEKSVREWARHEAALWGVTQHPSEILGFEGIDGAEVVKDQSSILQVFRLPGVESETLEALGIPPHLHEAVREDLVGGREKKGSRKGYSQCLISLHDQPGWIQTRIEVSPYEHSLLTYDPPASHSSRALDQYMTQQGYDDVASLRAQARIEATDVSPDPDPDPDPDLDLDLEVDADVDADAEVQADD